MFDMFLRRTINIALVVTGLCGADDASIPGIFRVEGSCPPTSVNTLVPSLPLMPYCVCISFVLTGVLEVGLGLRFS